SEAICLPSSTLRRVWAMTRSTSGSTRPAPVTQALGLRLGLLPQGRYDLPTLAHHLFRRLDQLRIQRLLLRLLLLHFAAELPMERLSDAAGRAQARAAGLLNVGKVITNQRFGALDETGEHAHAIDEQTAVGRMVNGGLHTGRIQAQLAPFRHP